MGQLYTLATLLLGNYPLVNIGEESAWTPEPVWTLLTRQYFTPTGNETLIDWLPGYCQGNSQIIVLFIIVHNNFAKSKGNVIVGPAWLQCWQLNCCRLEKGGSKVAEADKMNVTLSDVSQRENFRSVTDVLVIQLWLLFGPSVTWQLLFATSLCWSYTEVCCCRLCCWIWWEVWCSGGPSR
jgi:hypothetical protein